MKSVRFSLSEYVADLPVFEVDDHLKIDFNVLGTWAFVSADPRLLSRVCSHFVRPLGKQSLIKVWQYPIHSEKVADYQWGRYFDLIQEPALEIAQSGYLLDSLMAQNFASFFKLAPSIHGLFVLRAAGGTRHLAVLTEHPNWLPPTDILATEDIWAAILQLKVDYGLEPPWCDFTTSNHFIEGRLVDWQHSRLGEHFTKFLQGYYLKNTQFGDSKYQSAPAIGVNDGIRDSLKRTSDLRLDYLDFNGKTVLDLGCNGGQFLNYAAARGARYGLGIDWPNVVNAARYASNHLGHFNIEYVSHALHEGLPSECMPLKRFDVVLFLSMVTHVGVPDYLNELADLLIVEINHPHQVDDAIKRLELHYWLKPIGKASDHGDRAIFWCYHKRAFREAGLSHFDSL